jgi:hypothetical protein
MKQKVITPDCPRCHGALWWIPCPHPGGCTGEHFECTACGVEWVQREAEWLRFGAAGEVLEVLPPRVPRFRRRVTSL